MSIFGSFILIILLMFLGSSLIWTPYVKGNNQIRFFCTIISTTIFIVCCNIWKVSFTFINKFFFITLPGSFYLPLKSSEMMFGVDGLSVFLVLLTGLLFSICSIVAFDIVNKVRLFFTIFFVLEFFIFASFISLDYLIFYICFEAILIPMFLMIGLWGSRRRRMKAANYFLLFAFFGSLFMLIGIIIIYHTVGSTGWYDSYVFNYNLNTQKLLWILFFIGFAIKVPLWPFHIWLPEAHVEAPTIGSVILAGLLLKLGGYGFLRFVLPIFTDATKFFLPLAISLCVIGIVYASLTTIRQVDMKRIIAYSSVAHMSYGMLGIFSLNYYGIMGGIVLMLGHGLVSSALFLLVGVLYDTYGTRLIKYYGGLSQVMPLFSIFFFFFTVANMGLPGLCIFVGEFLTTIGIFATNTFAAVISAIAGVFTVAYMILLYNRVVFGTLKVQYIKKFKDISARDFYVLFILSYLTLLFGLCPQIFIESIEYTVFKFQRLYDVK